MVTLVVVMLQVQLLLAPSAVSNSNYGYFAGGRDPSKSPASTSSIDRLDFSNETILILDDGVTGIFQSRNGHTGVSNSNYGYFVGDSFSTNTNLCRLDFSNETTNIPPSRAPQGTRSEMAAVSTKPTTETIRKVRRGEFDASGLVYSNYGYFAGGELPFGDGAAEVSTIDRLDFVTETVSAPPSIHLTQERQSLAAVSNSNYGYFAGGLHLRFAPLTV
jgi:hypothetical protein